MMENKNKVTCGNCGFESEICDFPDFIEASSEIATILTKEDWGDTRAGLFIEENNGDIRYSEEGQEVFNEYYGTISEILSNTIRSEKKFNNGFKSWQNTHFQVSATIQERLNEENSAVITLTEKMAGFEGIQDLAESLTDKFENTHNKCIEQFNGVDCDAVNFDAIDEFLTKELE